MSSSSGPGPAPRSSSLRPTEAAGEPTPELKAAGTQLDCRRCRRVVEAWTDARVTRDSGVLLSVLT